MSAPPTVTHRARFAGPAVIVELDITVTPLPVLGAIAPRLAIAHAQAKAEELEARKLAETIYGGRSPRRFVGRTAQRAIASELYRQYYQRGAW